VNKFINILKKWYFYSRIINQKKKSEYQVRIEKAQEKIRRNLLSQTRENYTRVCATIDKRKRVKTAFSKSRDYSSCQKVASPTSNNSILQAYAIDYAKKIESPQTIMKIVKIKKTRNRSQTRSEVPEKYFKTINGHTKNLDNLVVKNVRLNEDLNLKTFYH